MNGHGALYIDAFLSLGIKVNGILVIVKLDNGSGRSLSIDNRL